MLSVPTHEKIFRREFYSAAATAFLAGVAITFLATHPEISYVNPVEAESYEAPLYCWTLAGAGFLTSSIWRRVPWWVTPVGMLVGQYAPFVFFAPFLLTNLIVHIILILYTAAMATGGCLAGKILAWGIRIVKRMIFAPAAQ